jgi:hypothetical protein
MGMMTQEECLAAIASGADTEELLGGAMPDARRRFRVIDKALCTFLADVRKHFPDAEYYTASGGFNLLLGKSHAGGGIQQSQLIALSGRASIGDGDF